MGINCGGKTDIGLKRETNQDAFIIENVGESLYLFTVCDGMGGAKGGSEASSLCADTFVKYVKGNLDETKKEQYIPTLEKALCAANEAVFGKANLSKEFEGMGTTLVSALFDGQKYYLIWVGDSRIYGICETEIVQLSHDHSFVQSLIDSGNISPQEAKNHPNRNIITKAVGIDREIEADVCEIDSENLKGILLCSDGLCGYVSERDIAETVRTTKEAEACCDKLVKLANDAGGTDNVTVVIHKKQ